MYEVYNTIDKNVYAAKKVFNPATNEKLDNNREKILDAYKRFIAEAEAMLNNNHKNIAKFEQSLRDSNGNLYIIMEYCNEGDLYKWRLDNLNQDGLLDEDLMIEILR